MDVTISITTCEDCPHHRDGAGWGDDFCEKAKKSLDNIHIPSWCPFKKVEQKKIEDSWERYPDRMGGQFTQEEIDRSRNGW